MAACEFYTYYGDKTCELRKNALKGKGSGTNTYTTSVLATCFNAVNTGNTYYCVASWTTGGDLWYVDPLSTSAEDCAYQCFTKRNSGCKAYTWLVEVPESTKKPLTIGKGTPKPTAKPKADNNRCLLYSDVLTDSTPASVPSYVVQSCLLAKDPLSGKPASRTPYNGGSKGGYTGGHHHRRMHMHTVVDHTTNTEVEVPDLGLGLTAALPATVVSDGDE